MPTTGRSAASSASQQQHSRKTSQSAAEYYQHRREKTKSSPSYAQRPQQRESAPVPVTQADHPTQAQRPSNKNRAHSAPLVPKSHLPGAKEATLADGDADEDDLSEDDEEIADDPFFQRFDMPQSDRHEQPSLKVSTSYHAESEDGEGPLSPTSTVMRARPDSTADPLGSPLSPRSSPLVRSPCPSYSYTLPLLMQKAVAREQRPSAGDQHCRSRLASRWQVCLHPESLQSPDASYDHDILAQNVDRRERIRCAID